jgi:hypothetical protein
MTVARSSSLPKLGVAVALMTTLKSAVDGRFNQMHTRENLRKQYDGVLKDDPTLPQLYRNSGSTTRSLVVREHGVLNMPETNIEIYNFLRKHKHFGATSSPMKRGNHEVAVIDRFASAYASREARLPWPGGWRQGASRV